MRLDASFDSQVRQVHGPEADALVASGATVLDVRSLEEFTTLGHIPGARLLPVHLSASAPAILDEADAPVLVCCEHAVRSRMAARLLAQAGFTRVHELAGGMAQWTGTRAFDAAPIAGPAQWLLENADLLPPSGRALDVACGRGRHALLLAAAGYEVTAVDHDRTALERLQVQADRLELTVATSEMNLEGDAVDLGEARYDVVLVTRYLHRPLFPALVRSLAPGGVLVYETFLVQQAERGQPKNPAFLLNPGELARLMAPLDVVRSREGEFEGKMVASVAALKT
jgi:rhodanese-related sulfurtransferase